jgi:hypothetical protein
MRIQTTTLLLLVLSVPALAQNTQNVIFINDSDANVAAGTSDTRRVVWVDYDDDGDLDYFELNYSFPNQVYENMGGGAFVQDNAGGNDLMGTSMAKGVAFGDIDGDGDLDAVIANGNNQANSVLLNLSAAPDNQPGVFSTIVSGIESELTQSYDAALGDVDGDFNLDLVIVNRYQNNDLYFGNGDGTFMHDPTSRIAIGEDGSRYVLMVDLDDDGDLDVAVANSTNVANFFYVNSGGLQGGVEGIFIIDNLDALGKPGKTYGLGAADLDIDGDIDLVAANRNQENTLYRNVLIDMAILAFETVDGTALEGTSADSYDVAIGDMEGDGDPDLIFANRVQNNEVYLATQADPLAASDGFAKVTQGTVVQDRGDSRSVALANVADFGDPLSGVPIMNTMELACGNTDGAASWFYNNYGEQWGDLGSSNGGVLGEPLLTGSGHTGAGQLLTFYLGNAPAASQTGFALSLNVTALPFKGGVLLADPTPGFGFLLATGPTNSAGEVSIPLGIPGVLPPGVGPGLAIYVQMIIVDPTVPAGMALSNCLRFRISD